MEERANYQSLELRADGRILIAEAQIDTPTSELWIYDLERGGSGARMTFYEGDDAHAVFTAEGDSTYFASTRQSPSPGGHYAVYRKPVSGQHQAELVWRQPGQDVWPADETVDGSLLLLGVGQWLNLDPAGMAILPRGDNELIELRPDSSTSLTWPQFSPEARFVAYASNVSGRPEVYVSALDVVGSGPGTRITLGGKWQVSREGGDQPRWSGDGRELFYLRSDNTLMAVAIQLGDGTFSMGSETPLFRVLQRADVTAYDVTADGQRFIVSTLGTGGGRSLVVVTDWAAQLQVPVPQ